MTNTREESPGYTHTNNTPRMYPFLKSMDIPLAFETHILVVGAGSAGCLAALAAARAGRHSVTLIERYGFPGGTSTQMLDTFYGFFSPGETPRKIVGGLPDQVVHALDQTGDIFLRPNTYGAGTGVNYNPERLKLVWDELLLSAGVRYLLHCALVDVDMNGDRPFDCVCWSKGGFFRIRASRVIDASGDADFTWLAGYPLEPAGEQEPAQSLTTTFRMCNVDLEAFKAAGGTAMLKRKMAEALDSGRHRLPRREGSAHAMCQPGCISTVAVRVVDQDPLDPQSLTKAEVEGRRQAFVYERFFQQDVPGYERSAIIGLSHQIGVRETRRVYGLHRLTKEECMAAAIPGDAVFLCAAPIEDHRKGGAGESETRWEYIPGSGVYGVPYGTLVPKGSDRSWVVGRCFSATHDAHASCRSMAQTMSMGQAAGIAAVLSLEEDTAAGEIPVSRLRTILADWGQVLEIPDRIADTSRDGWRNNK